jgi:adenylosuccinate synthase
MKNNLATIIADLTAGDAGKGTFTDFLCRKHESDFVIRYNGGAQAGHNVMDSNGIHHLFAQFSSGTLFGAKTLLSKYMMVSPFNFENEEEALQSIGISNSFNNVFIDENALVTTIFHRSVNRLLELSRGSNKHSSCGMGIGETALDNINNPTESIKIKDLTNKKLLLEKLEKCKNRMLARLSEKNISPIDNVCGRSFYADLDILVGGYSNFIKKVNIVTSKEVNELINASKFPIFEGSQGVILDETYGFYPYTTWSNITSHNALQLLKDCNWAGQKEVIGVTRTFATRHGVGPLPTEDLFLNKILTDKYNITNPWQDNFRFGWLDLNLLRYALEVDGNIDSLAVSHVDELQKLDKWKVCGHYTKDDKAWMLEKLKNPTIEDMEKLTKKIFDSRPFYGEYGRDEVLPLIEQELKLKIKIKSFGPKCNEKELIF